MKIEIVKFKNGKYAVRKKGFVSYVYIDKVDYYEWSLNNAETYCQGTLEEIKNLYNSIIDYGTPIKLIENKK